MMNFDEKYEEIHSIFNYGVDFFPFIIISCLESVYCCVLK